MYKIGQVPSSSKNVNKIFVLMDERTKILILLLLLRVTSCRLCSKHKNIIFISLSLSLSLSQNWFYQIFFFKLTILGFFFSISTFSINSEQVLHKCSLELLMMIGFEPRSSGFGSDRLVNFATTHLMGLSLSKFAQY